MFHFLFKINEHLNFEYLPSFKIVGITFDSLYRRDVLAVGVPRLNAGALQVKHSNIQF